MNTMTSMTLAAVVASVTLLGAGTAAAQEPEADADRGSLVTDPVTGGDEKQHAGKPLAGFYTVDLIGQKVQNRRTDSEVGTVSNLVIDQDGSVVAILVTGNAREGGGKRDLAIAWKQMDRVVEGDEITLSIDMDETALAALPEYAHN